MLVYNGCMKKGLLCVKRIIVLGLVGGMIGGLMGYLSSSDSHALTFSSDVEIGFTFNPVLQVSLSSADLVINNLAPGASSDSNEITVTVNTNTAYGYTLNATVGQATNYETRDLVLSGNNASFASLDYGASLASLTSDNTWGFSYQTSASGASWSNYSGLPQYDDEENVTTLIATDDPAATDYVKFKIGAKAGTSQVSGEYKNVINFVAVANPEPHLNPVECEAGKICYNVNSLDPTEGTMGKQTASSSSEVTLLASNFSRTGYGFAGWSDVYDYATNPNAHFYGPQQDVTTPANTGTDGWSLYAVWIKSAGTLQANATSVCNRLTTTPIDGAANLSSVSALTDQRDNETYAIAKLADGNCWMIENLRLESTAEHNSDGTLSQGYGGQFAGLAGPETPDKFSDTYSANSLYSNDGANDTINIGTSNTAYRMPRYNNINTPTTASDRPQNPTSNSATNTTSNASMYSYGNYYSWPAVIADTTAYTSNNTSVTSTSICPSGWRLPKGGQTTVNATAEFYVLGKSLMKDGEGASIEPNKNASYGYGYYDNTPTNADGDTATKAFRKYPNNFVYSGYVYNGSVSSRGAYGVFWSSTASSSNHAYYLYLDSAGVNPGTINYVKYGGWTVRCVVSGV